MRWALRSFLSIAGNVFLGRLGGAVLRDSNLVFDVHVMAVVGAVLGASFSSYNCILSTKPVKLRFNHFRIKLCNPHKK